MSDLIERLRALARSEHSDFSIGDESADEIERLTRERDELRRQLAEAGESIARQAATIRDLTRPAEEA